MVLAVIPVGEVVQPHQRRAGLVIYGIVIFHIRFLTHFVFHFVRVVFVVIFKILFKEFILVPEGVVVVYLIELLLNAFQVPAKQPVYHQKCEDTLGSGNKPRILLSQ